MSASTPVAITLTVEQWFDIRHALAIVGLPTDLLLRDAIAEQLFEQDALS